MSIALLSDANTPGPFRNTFVPATNGVESLAEALGAEIWHGRALDALSLGALREYGHILVNLNHTLWPVVPALKRHCQGAVVCGYQEGASDLTERMRPRMLAAYLDAVRAVDVFLAYDPDVVEHFRDIRAGRATFWLPLPAATAQYALEKIPMAERPRYPEHVAVGPMLDQARGGYRSLIAAAKTGGRVIAHARTPQEAALAARIICEHGGIPDVEGWLHWSKPMRVEKLYVERPPFNDEPESFLQRLARCRRAFNLDTERCYGRFTLDCIGLEVPCRLSRGLMRPKLHTAEEVRGMWERTICDCSLLKSDF